MNGRIKEKLAVKEALSPGIFIISDLHMKETRMQKKVRLAVDRQMKKMKISPIVLGDCFEVKGALK